MATQYGSVFVVFNPTTKTYECFVRPLSLAPPRLCTIDSGLDFLVDKFQTVLNVILCKALNFFPL